MIDLLHIFQKINKEKLVASESLQSDSALDSDTVQSSFEFESSPKIIFVDSEFNEIKYYDELSELTLSDEETSVVTHYLSELHNNQGFYNGDQIMISGLKYDSESNTVYIQAIKVKYVFLRALELKKFDSSSQLYNKCLFKAGVLIPYITTDGHTFFMERKRDSTYCSVAGFLEPSVNKEMNPKYNLVTETAIRETIEELLGDAEGDVTRKFSMPKLKSISFRRSSAMHTVDFIAPAFVDFSSDQISYLIKNNKSKDAKEHTQQFITVPLYDHDRADAVNFLKLGTRIYPGGFTYLPALVSCAILANMHHNFVPKTLPYSRTMILSPRSFLSTINRGVSMHNLDFDIPYDNFIFDVGNVLLSWDPKRIMDKALPDNLNHEKYITEIFKHPDWLKMDQGLLTDEEAIDLFSKRTGLSEAEVANILICAKDSLSPIQDGFMLLNKFHNMGKNLYCLTNMPTSTFDFLCKKYKFWNVFKGIVVSGDVKMIKPDTKIFHHILTQYNLVPSRTMFFDDSKDNVLESSRVGIASILFTKNINEVIHDIKINCGYSSSVNASNRKI